VEWPAEFTDDEIAGHLRQLYEKARRPPPSPDRLGGQARVCRVLRAILGFIRVRERVVNTSGRLVPAAALTAGEDLLSCDPAVQYLHCLTMNEDLVPTQGSGHKELVDENGNRLPFKLTFLVKKAIVASSTLLLPGLVLVDVPGTGDTNLARGKRGQEVLAESSYAIHVIEQDR
jgi:hypothetical protein